MLLLALFTAGTALAGTAYAAPAAGEPHELVRSLQAVQDEIANGNAEAHGGLLALIGRIGEKFLAAEPAVWTDPQNG